MPLVGAPPHALGSGSGLMTPIRAMAGNFDGNDQARVSVSLPFDGGSPRFQGIIRQLSFAVHRSALTPFHRIRVGH